MSDLCACWWPFGRRNSERNSDGWSPSPLIQARTKPIAIVQGSPLVEQACRKASFAALYDLGPEIGSGSTSTVHKSTQKASGKVFATKVVSAAGLQTPGVADQFASEVLALKRCRHPHVVSLEDAVVDENKLYLVTELLTGGELFDYVVKRGTLGEDEAASILSDVGDAIRFMHDQGVIHRDLKPENLLLAKESPVGFPTVKIIDFGLSKARATRDVCASFLGTRGYLAPEMVIDRCPRAFERRRRVDCVRIAAARGERRRVSRAAQAADVQRGRRHVGLRRHRVCLAVRLPAL